MSISSQRYGYRSRQYLVDQVTSIDLNCRKIHKRVLRITVNCANKSFDQSRSARINLKGNVFLKFTCKF